MAREAIFRRKVGEHRREVRIAESVARQLTSAVYGAAGNKDAGKIAAKVSFLPRPSRSDAPAGQQAPRTGQRVISTEYALQRFGAPPPTSGGGDGG